MHEDIRKKLQAAKKGGEPCSAIETGIKSNDSKKSRQYLEIPHQVEPAAVIDDKDGKLLTDKREFLNKWTKYCDGLYNYELDPDTSSLQADQYPTESENNQLILEEEVRSRSMETW